MLDDFKPKKLPMAARINTNSESVPPPDIDQEIGDAFAPPEAVAALDNSQLNDEPIIIDNDAVKANDVKPPKSPKQKWEWWPPSSWTRKQTILVVSGALLALVLITALLFFVVFAKKPAKIQSTQPQKVVKKEVKPTTVPSRLTGLPIPLNQKDIPVTGIMIENSLDARPQSGLKDAGIVFEAVAEGGITRFLALFEETQPDYVGPIRSIRPYYLDWLLPFDASIAHVGGSPDALAKIKTTGAKDLDQFYNSNSYDRIGSRAAPHNVYTSLGRLIDLEKGKGLDKSTFTSLTRKVEAPSKLPTASSIDFTISGPAFSVHYDYDVATNSYKRSEGGQPHIDEKTTAQLSPKVVITLVTDQSLDGDGLHTVYNTTGTGSMYVFQDGVFTLGNWTKNDAKSQFTFTDQVGKPIDLNPGQTWISIVGLSGDVSYK